jgi:lipoprotein-releasing system ATP-binding protein
MTKVLVLENVSRTYVQGGQETKILENANLTLNKGEIIALIGPSGSGKSTLLHIAGLLDRPSGGEVRVLGKSCNELSDKDRTSIRGHNIGFIYQFHNLLNEFTALENVMMPKIIRGFSKEQAKDSAAAILKGIGLGHRLKHYPSQLSGGELQRVAIARALVNKPNLILADEPTGNLDPDNSQYVFKLLISAVRNLGISCIVVTHNLSLTEQVDRVLTFRAKNIIEC